MKINCQIVNCPKEAELSCICNSKVSFVRYISLVFIKNFQESMII